jgi:uncharacterized membrane protein
MNHLPTLAAIVLTLVLQPATAAPPMYRAIDIGKLPEARYIIPYGLNNSGTVVGNAQYARGVSAFSWTRTDGISKLPVPPGGEAESYAHDINDAGQIIGRVISGGPLGTGGEVIWEVDGSFNFYLGDTWAATARPDSIPQITNAGRVLGQSYLDDSGVDIFPWVWSPQRGLIDIVALGDDRYQAYQMNDGGRIVGYRASCSIGVSSAFIYDAPTQRMRWLDPDHDKFCRQSSATAVNDHGDVVGWVETYDRGRTVAMIWTEADGWQTLSDSLAPNRATIWATDINNARQVVGGLQLMNQTWRLSFFYWDKDNGLYDLKKLLDPDDPMTAEVILHASNSTPDSPYIPKINDRGEILVSGSLRGDKDIFLQPQRAFLLVPVQKQQQQ